MTFQDKQILQKILAQDVAIGSVFNLFVRQVAPLLERYNYGSKEVWVKNSLLEQRINKEVERLNYNLKNVVEGNQKWAWLLAKSKNDNLVDSFIKGMTLPTSVKEGLFAQNLRAFEQFTNRKTNGFSVSENIWRTSKQAKTQLEFYLESGIAQGRSAATISRDVRQLLQDPDTLFRRVRDKNGNLVPSKPMKNYHPGQGKYRSAYKNALRLSATEINMTYRSSDHERWQGLDFVVGIDIKLSKAHPREDICDFMKGRYPKDFKFTGWHPFCICFAIAVLMPQEDFINYLDADLDSRQAIILRNKVQGIPNTASQYLDKHQVSIDGWKKPPIWVKDNFVGKKIGNGLLMTNAKKINDLIAHSSIANTRNIYSSFEPFSPMIFRKLEELGNERQRQKFLLEIVKDESFQELDLGLMFNAKTFVHPLHKMKGKGWAFEKEMAKDINRSGRDVYFLPEHQDKKSADAITLFKEKWTVVDLKYSNTVNAHTLYSDLRNGFAQSSTLALKVRNGDLNLIRDAIAELKRKDSFIGNIIFINKYGKLIEIERKDFNTTRYLKKLRGFF